MGRRSLLLACLLSGALTSQGSVPPGTAPEAVRTVVFTPMWVTVTILQEDTGSTPSASENKRWVAATLTLFLGPFGAHRLYLGTTAKVPIVYGITFGGFGVLALIDLGHILFTRDLTRFEHNDHVFMWARPRTPLTPP